MEEIHEAVLLMEQNKTEEAISVLESYLPSASEEERYTIAELYMQWGMLEEAKGILEGLVAQYPKESDLKLMLAEIHIDLQEDEDAIDILNQFTAADEEYLEVLIQLADLYQTQGLFEVAEQKLLEAKRLDPVEPVIDLALGELAFSTGEYTKSIPYYEAVYQVEQVIGDIEIGVRLAEAYAATGEFEKALDFYQSTDSENPDAIFRHGFTAYRANRLDIAINAWEKLIEADPYYQSVYLYLAQSYETEGRVEEAYETAKKGLEIDEFNKELYHLAGMLARRMGNYHESVQMIKQAIAIDPGFKEAILLLTEIYKAEDAFEDIIELLTHTLEMGEEDAAFHWELAKAYAETEQFQQALDNYKKSYPDLREDADFLKEYGYFLVEEGHIRQAILVFNQYLAIEPSDDEVEAYLERLNATQEEDGL